MNNDIVFKVSLRLEEDLETELEDFALLARLGITNEAYHILRKVLLQHLSNFAVVAEIVQFLLDQQDWAFLDVVLKDVHTRDLALNNEQQALLQSLSSLSRAKTAPNTSPSRPRAIQVNVANVSSTVLQIEEVYLLQYAKISGKDITNVLRSYFIILKDADLAWEAVRIFSLICRFAWESSAARTGWMMRRNLHHILVTWLQSDQLDPGFTQQMQIDQQTCLLRAHYAYLHDILHDVLNARPNENVMDLQALKAGSLPEDMTAETILEISKICKLILSTIRDVVKFSFDPTPRGEIFYFCQVLEQKVHELLLIKRILPHKRDSMISRSQNLVFPDLDPPAEIPVQSQSHEKTNPRRSAADIHSTITHANSDRISLVETILAQNLEQARSHNSRSTRSSTPILTDSKFKSIDSIGVSRYSGFQRAGTIFSRKNTGTNLDIPNHSVEQQFPTFELDQDDLWEWLETYFPESTPIDVKIENGNYVFKISRGLNFDDVTAILDLRKAPINSR